ncbi:MAG: DUF368 domain-containing protein [Bacilli bacterium]|nr:DUF368 domain-containing protein [Bacilli bacterium]MBN2877090.1 DUF368 domain-containing protein [Bacilli bacterium]
MAGLLQLLILVAKGFIIGIAFVIPGVSGGTLAIYLGVYKKLLHSIGNIFKEFKQSLMFLGPLFLGIGISIVALAKLFGLLLEWNSFIVIGFFIGLILGGIKQIYTETEGGKPNVASILSFAFAFSLIILLIIFGKVRTTTAVETIDISVGNLILVFFLGMVASATMIVPGISGSALLIVLGFYTAIVSNVVGNILDFGNLLYNLEIIIPFALGAAVGIILISRLIEYVLKHYKVQTYYAILGFIIASIIAMFFEIRDPATAADFTNQTPIYSNVFGYIGSNWWVLLAGAIAVIVGFVASKQLSKIELKEGAA